MDQKTADELVRNFEDTRDIELLDIEAVRIEKSEHYKITFKNILTGEEYSPAYRKTDFEAKMERIRSKFFYKLHKWANVAVYLLDRIKKLEKTVKLMEESKSTCTCDANQKMIRIREEAHKMAEALNRI